MAEQIPRSSEFLPRTAQNEQVLPVWLANAGMSILDVLEDGSEDFKHPLLERKSRLIPLRENGILRLAAIKSKRKGAELSVFSIQLGMDDGSGTKHLLKFSWGTDNPEFQRATYESRWEEPGAPWPEVKTRHEERQEFDKDDQENIMGIISTALEECGIVQDEDFFESVRTADA